MSVLSARVTAAFVWSLLGVVLAFAAVILVLTWSATQSRADTPTKKNVYRGLALAGIQVGRGAFLDDKHCRLDYLRVVGPRRGGYFSIIIKPTC